MVGGKGATASRRLEDDEHQMGGIHCGKLLMKRQMEYGQGGKEMTGKTRVGVGCSRVSKQITRGVGEPQGKRGPQEPLERGPQTCRPGTTSLRPTG